MRLRAVMVTSLTTISGLIPTAYRGPRALRRVPLGLGAERDVFAVVRESSVEGPVLALLAELRDWFRGADLDGVSGAWTGGEETPLETPTD